MSDVRLGPEGSRGPRGADGRVGATGPTGPAGVGSTVQGMSIINGNSPGTVIAAQHPGDTFIEVILGNDFAPTHIDLGVVPEPNTVIQVGVSQSSGSNTMTLTGGSGTTGTSFPISTTLATPLTAQQLATLIFNGSAWSPFR